MVEEDEKTIGNKFATLRVLKVVVRHPSAILIIKTNVLNKVGDAVGFVVI